MGRETKIELLKIFGMIVILVALIFGIVWLNKAQDTAANEINTATEQTNSETSEEKEDTEKNESSKKDNSKKSNKKENNKKSSNSEKKK